MKWVAGSALTFLFVLVWAFLVESEPEPTTSVRHRQDGQKRVLGSLKWRSTPRWNIPVRNKEEIPKKSLSDAIMDDDVCALLMNEDINDSEKLLQAYLTANSKATEAAVLSVLSESDNSKSLAGMFYRALRKSGQLYGPTRPLDLKGALEDFRQLEALDPENGAYAVFAAPVLLELKAPVETQMKYYQRAFSKPRFDTFQTDIAQAFESTGRHSTAQFLAAQILLAGAPSPSYSEFNALTSRFVEKDDGSFSKLALKFSDRVLKNVQSEAGNLEEYSYNQVEYQMIRGLYLRSFKKLYPGTVNIPNYKDLMRSPASNGQTISDLATALEPMQKSLDCERARVDEVFYTWKQTP